MVANLLSLANSLKRQGRKHEMFPVTYRRNMTIYFSLTRLLKLIQ